MLSSAFSSPTSLSWENTAIPIVSLIVLALRGISPAV